MIRIGYDADTQRYTFKDNKTGCIYQGEPRAEYGKMDLVSSPISESTKSVELNSSSRKEMWGKPGRGKGFLVHRLMPSFLHYPKIN
jgi:hypothetical protein